ncbi:MAG: hypothetical protein U9N82_07320 [Thermodesulfobacteriota bacterium]|nr:hypothetical protein [Thermodesulfobacteriota bacterium]
MELGGADVDIETGSPLPVMQKKREEKRIGRIISEYQELVNDLSGGGGEVLKKIAALYAIRINEIIKTDPACQAYQMVFDELNIKVNIGRKLVNSKISGLEEGRL